MLQFYKLGFREDFSKFIHEGLSSKSFSQTWPVILNLITPYKICKIAVKYLALCFKFSFIYCYPVQKTKRILFQTWIFKTYQHHCVENVLNVTPIVLFKVQDCQHWHFGDPKYFLGLVVWAISNIIGPVELNSRSTVVFKIVKLSKTKSNRCFCQAIQAIKMHKEKVVISDFFCKANHMWVRDGLNVAPDQ